MGASVPAIPERVSVAMSEIAENMHEGLLALAVGAGLQVMQALMEADVSTLAGPKGKHNMVRMAVRHGRERGSVTLGGRRVPITRPRVRAADGSGEVAIAVVWVVQLDGVAGQDGVGEDARRPVDSPLPGRA